MGPMAEAYFRALWERRGKAIDLRPLAVKFADGTSPRVGDCHRNVDLWVEQNPEYQPVRGWALNSLPGGLENWVAHSVIVSGCGPVLDITLPSGCTFLFHEGDEEHFLDVRTECSGIWLPLISI